ncbi:MAG: hypothetical protein HYX86_04545 [Chloroflexi bacterium]|nr:hypothetical protein [Chloroflexota bacterium]
MEQKSVVEFTFERATKNTFRYQEVVESGQPPKVGTIYIQKWVTGTKTPAKITVTIEWE